MICFEIYHNDRRLCVAGVGKYGMLNQGLVWSRPPPADRPPYRDGPDSDFRFFVHGSRAGESLWWVGPDFPIEPGDEIRVRVLEADAVDDPARVGRRQQGESARESRRRLYQALRSEFESDDAAA